MTTLEQVYADIQQAQARGVTMAYYMKQMHPVPRTTVVDRVAYLQQQCVGKRVLHLGCSSGELHAALWQVAASLEGWDSEPLTGTPLSGTFRQVDLDDYAHLTALHDLYGPGAFDVVVAGEILEHLGNPGNVLQFVRQFQCPLVISVPNAFSDVGRYHISGGVENVHTQHTCWYSWRTLTTLVERYGYRVVEWYWYNGKPLTAEGLVFLVS